MNAWPLAPGGLGGGVGFRQVFNLARKLEVDGEPAINDRNVRAKLATWYAQETGLKYSGYRALSALSRGDTPGPENSIGKLVAASKTQDMASFAMDLLELSGAISDPSLRRSARDVSKRRSWVPPAGRIAGGQRRDHAEHPLRARPGAASGRAGRQGYPLQRGANGTVVGQPTGRSLRQTSVAATGDGGSPAVQWYNCDSSGSVICSAFSRMRARRTSASPDACLRTWDMVDRSFSGRLNSQGSLRLAKGLADTLIDRPLRRAPLGGKLADQLGEEGFDFVAGNDRVHDFPSRSSDRLQSIQGLCASAEPR